MLKISLLALTLFSSWFATAACFDGVSTSSSVTSKIRGFFINQGSFDGPEHFVILDKATCSAAPTGDATLAPTTKNHYYLSFKSSDETLYASLLSAQARDITVEFRITAPVASSQVNAIAYIISPAGARSQ